MYSNAYTCTTYHARTEMRFRMGVRGVKYLYKGEVLAYKSADSYDDLICAMSQFVRKDPPPSLGTNEIFQKWGGGFHPPPEIRNRTSVRAWLTCKCVCVCVC